MNIQIDYKIKIQIDPSEVQILATELYQSYLRVRNKDLGQLHDFLVGYEVLKSLIKKYQMDTQRQIIEGYQRTKPYSLKLNKLSCLWLFLFIEDRQLVELANLHTNILGKHITEYTHQ